MEENPIQCELSWKCFGCLICTSKISIFALICISYSYLTPYRRPVFYFIVSSYKLSGFVPILHTDCTQTLPKNPVLTPISNPVTEAAPVEFFYSTPRNCSEFSSEILPTIHKKSLEFHCQPASSSRHLHIRKIPVTVKVTGTLYILSAKSDKRWNFKACEVPKTAVYCCKWGFEGQA